MQGLRPSWREAEGEKAWQATCRKTLKGESREPLTMANKTLSRRHDLLTGQAIRFKILNRQLLGKAWISLVGCWIGGQDSCLGRDADWRHGSCPELGKQKIGLRPIEANR